MKKFFIYSTIFLGLFVLALFLLPQLFKGKIKTEIEKQINQKVNAEVSFADIDLTIFPNFPNITASLDNFLIINKAPFAGDTLLSMKSFAIEVNLKSVVFGDEIKINGIYLIEPRINVKVLKNGQANYDIAKAQPEELPDTAKTKFSADVDAWKIENGYLSYNDKALNTNVFIENINHSGSGDFNQDEFDLELKTTIEKFTANYENVTYLNKVRMQADMILGIVNATQTYTFKENHAQINDFAMGFDGFFTMLEKGGYDMNINFLAKQTDFKNIISLIPALYLKDYKDLETKGTMAFSGFVKGIFDSEKNRMPAYNVKLQVNDGYFKYPKLPTPVSEVLVDMEVDNKTGITANTVIDIRKFAMKLGTNPINGRVKVQNLKNYPIDADISAKVNLAEMTQVFPIDSMTLRGIYELRIKANGVYDTVQKTIPKIDALMKLTDGYVKSEAYPTMPMENMTVLAMVKNVTGKKADTEIVIENLALKLQEKPFAMHGNFKNIDDITYDITVKGEIDLDKMTKIYPLEDKKITGNLLADIKTAGKLSDAKAKKYDKLPTSGTMSLSNFAFSSKTFHQGLTIKNAIMTFSPQNIKLEKYEGTVGKSAIAMAGQISNYIPYLLSGEVIKANLSFHSPKFDCNEWLTEEKPKNGQEAPLTVIELPKNVDFSFAATIGEVQYTNMKLANANGNVFLQRGILRLEGFQFATLGGNFIANGSYNPINIAKPSFDFDMNINNVAVQEAYKTFNTVQSLMPLSQHITGDFTTGFKLKGELGQDMMPILGSLSGGGLIKLFDAALQNAELIDKLKSLLKLDNVSNKLKNVDLQAKIEAGKLYITNTPFKLGDLAGTIQGNNGLDGSLEYLLELNVPKGKMGAELSSKLDQYIGTNAAAKETVKLLINIGGNYKKPSFAIAKGTVDEIKQEFQQKIEEKKQQAVDSVKQVAAETAKQVVTDFLKKDSTSQAPQKRAEDAINRLKTGLFGGFGKKKEEPKEPEKPKDEEKPKEVQKDSTGN
jgi:hypothetical protein